MERRSGEQDAFEHDMDTTTAICEEMLVRVVEWD